jgi:signal transduction histidine kinase/ligand-binding sensor domain-containing protein/DNA-binding response OmpR family regulator
LIDLIVLNIGTIPATHQHTNVPAPQRTACLQPMPPLNINQPPQKSGCKVIFLRMHRTVIAVVLVLLGCSTVPTVAQFAPQNIVKHYSLKDGLSQGVVNSIAEDSQSFIWVATEDGLNRFDAHSFKVFKYQKGNTSGISGNFIQDIFKDRDGTLWVSSRNGLQKFDPNFEVFNLYTNGLSTSNGPSLNDVSCITEGSSGNLWVAWYANGFGSFDKTTEKFTVYNSSSLPSLSSGQTLSLLDDSHGLLWVGTQDGGLNVFNVKNARVVDKVEALSDPAHLPSLNVRCIAEDPKKNIWIGTSRGLVVYLRNLNKFVNFNFNAVMKERTILSLLSDANENLWIGTQGSGIFRLDLRQFDTHRAENFTFTRLESLDGYDISSKSVQAFYEDNHKNIWAGTHGDGVYMISSEKEKFITFQKLINKGSTFTATSFYGMCYDREGNLWLGTDGNGLYKHSLSDNTGTHYLADGRSGSIPDNSIQSALCDSKGRLWFGTYAKGVFQFDRSTGKFTRYRYIDKYQTRTGPQDVRVIMEDSKNNIWVGTNRGGLCLLDPATRTYANPGTFHDILRDGDVRSIAEDASGNLWLGFYGDGLYKFNDSTMSLTPYFHRPAERNFIDSRIVFSLSFDDSGRLWIGTADNGLSVYDFTTDVLRNFTEEKGLANNTVYAILIDKNTGWVSTNAGVSKIETPSFTITNYDVLDGLQPGQFNAGAALFNRNGGYMCFGGTEGLNVFYPGLIKDVSQKSKAIITGLEIFNRPVSVRDTVDGKVILNQVINQTKEISLDYDQSVITFEFIGLNYTYPEKNTYAYKLEGLDTKWNFVGSQRTATYRYLKPAHYEFKVKVLNRGDAWDNEDDNYTSLDVIINPPFWQTPLAYALYFITASLVVFVGYKVGKKQIPLRKRLKIEKAQRKHERRMAMEKLTFFTEISHEFRTPLTLILGPIEEMLSKEDSQSANARKLMMVHRNANKLLNLINKLLDYRKVESGNVILKIRETDIIPFIEETYESFKDLAAKKNIRYSFQTEVPSIKVWFDSEKLEMVLTNILSNSFKYIGTGNEICISVSTQLSDKYPQGRIVIRIRDNGIGIPKKQLGNIFDWFYKGDNSGLMNSGIGLSLARKLVHLHKGDIFVESTEGKGSTFSVKIPLGKDHFKPDEISIVTDEPPENQPAVIPAIEGEEDGPVKRAIPSLLIIEDDEEIRLFLREYFENEYKIFEAANGNDGLDMANTYHPDLIISDIMMPGKDGIEVCQILKNNMRTSHIPIILLTAKTSMVHHKEGIETGADAYIMKPFSPEILALTISNLLQSRNQLMMFYRNLFIGNGEPGAATKDSPSPDETFLQTVFEQLRSNLDKPDFNVAELSGVLNMSRSLVYRKIKMLTGLSPTEYIRTLRLQEAAKLLRTQKYKVFEVVYMVGFSDLKYFRQCFAKEFGISPSEYMKHPET